MKSTYRHYPVLALAAALLASCATTGGQVKPSQAFKPVKGADLPVFSDTQDGDALLASAAKSAAYLKNGASRNPYTIGGRDVTAVDLAAALDKFVALYKSAKTPQELDSLIKANFDIYRSIGYDGNGKVIFSSYYAPILEASLKKDDVYKYPAYARPPDLVDINLETFNPDKYKGEIVRGRLDGSNVVPYWSREYIDILGFLEGKGLEIAYFKDRLELMDLHVEGSGRIKLPDGTIKKISFAGTNGLPFRGVISAMATAGLVDKADKPREHAREYINSHPDMAPFVLAWNKRYTFFKLEDLGGPEDGAIGTIGRSLTGGRSIAVDPKYIPLGALVFVRVPLPSIGPDGKATAPKPTSKFVLCQDTGGAILGPGHIDYFSGMGDEAGEIANNMWNDGEVFILLLKEGKK